MRFAVWLLSGSAILAQNSATITGKVSDTDGAALAKAAIQAKNVATGAVYKTDSSPTGAYTLPRLPAGTYELLARVPGMLPFEQKNIAVGVEQTRISGSATGLCHFSSLDDFTVKIRRP